MRYRSYPKADLRKKVSEVAACNTKSRNLLYADPKSQAAMFFRFNGIGSNNYKQLVRDTVMGSCRRR